jgi:hypothetical protein
MGAVKTKKPPGGYPAGGYSKLNLSKPQTGADNRPDKRRLMLILFSRRESAHRIALKADAALPRIIVNSALMMDRTTLQDCRPKSKKTSIV